MQLPDAIVGDLDSVEPDVQKYYEQRGVEISFDGDQYSTDLIKCLHWLRKHSDERNTENHHAGTSDLDVVVLGGLGGRVDQGFSQIHHMYMALNNRNLLRGRMYLLSEQSISFVLEVGLNKIQCAENGEPDIFGENIGIIPVGGPAVITTKGLEWDVQDWKTELGGQISTSNHIRADAIEIQSDKRVLFTVELVPRLCAKG